MQFRQAERASPSRPSRPPTLLVAFSPESRSNQKNRPNEGPRCPRSHQMHSVPDHQRDHRACPAAKHDLDVWRAPSFSQESFRCQTRPTPRQLDQRRAQFISSRSTSRVASLRRWQKYDDSERNGPKAQRSKCRSPKIPSQAPAFISIASWTSLLTRA